MPSVRESGKKINWRLFCFLSLNDDEECERVAPVAEAFSSADRLPFTRQPTARQARWGHRPAENHDWTEKSSRSAVFLPGLRLCPVPNAYRESVIDAPSFFSIDLSIPLHRRCGNYTIINVDNLCVFAVCCWRWLCLPWRKRINNMYKQPHPMTV